MDLHITNVDRLSEGCVLAAVYSPIIHTVDIQVICIQGSVTCIVPSIGIVAVSSNFDRIVPRPINWYRTIAKKRTVRDRRCQCRLTTPSRRVEKHLCNTRKIGASNSDFAKCHVPMPLVIPSVVLDTNCSSTDVIQSLIVVTDFIGTNLENTVRWNKSCTVEVLSPDFHPPCFW